MTEKFTLSEIAEMVQIIERLTNTEVSLKLPPPFPDNSVFNLADYRKFCESKRGDKV